MSVTPAVLTEPVLTQREAAPVTVIQSEEILRTRTPAYSQTNSDISFMVRQPSASAILANYVEVLLEVEFTASADFSFASTLKSDFTAQTQGTKDHGFVAEGLPLQSKCIRNAVLTINGTSQSMRVNEFGKDYCKMHCNRKYMEKIGNGWNDGSKQMIENLGTNGYGTSGARNSRVISVSDSKQAKSWQRQMTQDDSKTSEDLGDKKVTYKFQIREPLFIGPFGAFSFAQSFPAWSSEGMKSPGLLHVHNMQLQLALEDNWQNALFLPVYQAATLSNFSSVGLPIIKKAELVCKWVLPPPRLVSAALTQSVSYASYDVLRFIAQPNNNTTLVEKNDTVSFKLNSVSFPYMPSIFCFSIMPHYAHCSGVICGSGKDVAVVESMKKDKRLTVTHMDLSINTSSASLPYKGSQDVQTRRLNARDLYMMTLENAASFEDFPDDFEEWFNGGGFCAITPAQLSGNLNSPCIRGNVVVQGDIYAINKTGHPLNVATQSVAWTGSAAVYPQGVALPRYQCVVSGFYSNRSLVLDAKSGIMQESTYSQAFQQNLRLGSGGN